MGTLSNDDNGHMAFNDWISRSDEERGWLELEIKPEMLCDFMELYYGYVDVIEFDGIEYCFVGEFKLSNNELESVFGIVCVNEGRFMYYSNEDFMEDIINGDDGKLDKLKEFIESN